MSGLANSRTAKYRNSMSMKTLVTGLVLASGLVLGACSTSYGAKTGPDNQAIAKQALETDRLQAINAALQVKDRPEGHAQRDSWRKPELVLGFSGIKSGDKIADLGAGGGYFSRLLSSLAGPSGHVIVQNPPEWVEKYGKNMIPALDQLVRDRANISRKDAYFDQLDIEHGSLDAVTMALIYHDVVLLPADRTKMNAQIFAALKSGGVLVITDHHGKSGSGKDEIDALHRMDVQMVMDDVLAAGFALDATSTALASEADDVELNVFDPKVRGKTNRFLLRFKKP